MLGFSTRQLLEVINYDYSSEKLPPEMDGFKIVQITDLHNHDLEYENGNLLNLIREQNPDIILYTGDLIDHNSSVDTIETLRAIFNEFKDVPSYMVEGNHETYAKMTEEFWALVDSYSNITYLRDTSVTYIHNGFKFNISGIHDVIEQNGDKTGYFKKDSDLDIEPFIKEAKEKCDPSCSFNLLLSHRPDHLKMFDKYGYDLVLSGHTHGGQVGVFPLNYEYKLNGERRYMTGKFELGNTTLLVSNGQGFSGKMPFRYKCPMQLLTVTFKTK